jgi:hypothetical protein
MYQDVSTVGRMLLLEVDYLVVGTTKCKIIQLSKLVDLVVRGKSEVSIIFSK